MLVIHTSDDFFDKKKPMAQLSTAEN